MIFNARKTSPENPLNQAHLDHNATREDEREALARKKQDQLESFRS